MGLVFVTDDFAVDPDDVSSLEKYSKYNHSASPSGDSCFDHAGTIVIQKNGRKTYVRDISPERVHELIFGKIVSPKNKMFPQLRTGESISGND